MSRSRLAWALGLIGVVLVAFAGGIVWAVLRPQEGPPAAPVSALKIVTTEPGLYWLDGRALAQAGLDPSEVPTPTWQLSLGGEPVPLVRRGSGREIQLIWYAPPNDSPYSSSQFFRLTSDPAHPSPEPAVLLPEAAAVAAAPATTRFRLEQQAIYYPSAPRDGDHWYDRQLYGGDEATLTVSLPAQPVGPGTVRLHLWAKSSDPNATPDHRAALRLNEHELGAFDFEGHGLWTITATVPAEAWRAGENALSLRLPGTTGAAVEQNILDWVEVEAPLPLGLHGGRADLEGNGAVEVALGEPAEVWDVAVVDQPRRVLAGPGSLVVGPVAPEGIRLLAASDAGLRRPARLEPFVGETLLGDQQGADYLVIAPPDLRPALQPLLDYRAAQGLRVRVAELPAIYDAYGHGVPSPEAIQAFLLAARERWEPPAPRFVLLVGDASYDPRAYLGTASDRLPTCFVDTVYVGQTASDQCYADLDNDGRPEFALGRLPARDSTELGTIVAKTIAADRGAGDGAAWRRRALLVADTEPEYSLLSQTLSDTYLTPRGYEVTHFSLADPTHVAPEAARRALRERFDAGVGLINYAGHGSIKIWGKEAVLTIEDAPTLANDGQWPIVSAMTCLSGFFQHPTVPSLAEALLWSPTGGAVAAYVPSSEGTTPEQTPVATTFFDAVTGGETATLGEAIVASRLALAESGATTPDMLQTFNLLGDPALRLAHP